MTKKKRPSPRRSAAAKKGWTTWRAKARERSAAAKKGWKTRLEKAVGKKQRAKPRPKKTKNRKRPTPKQKTKTPKVTPKEEWEVTISYRETDGHRLDVTVRVLTPAGTTRAQVESAVRRAIYGNSLTEYEIQWIDWQRFTRNGSAASMQRTGTGEDLATMRAPLLAGRWRTARVEV